MAECKPFKDLKKLLAEHTVKLPVAPPIKKADPHTRPPSNKSEESLFRKAMADVTPLKGRKRHVASNHFSVDRIAPSSKDAEDDVLLKLKELVKHGTGFKVALTPEYMEGIGPQVCPELSKRLHRGDFSVQAHIDLHGLRVSEAQKAFEAFLSRSIRNGLQAVLVVHGRGLSSPAAPVLKTNLYKWLTQGPWRKWVLAFASAPNHDGGAGATYIMLRKKPLPKRLCKRKNQTSK